MDKRQLIEQIQVRNISATQQFLSQFSAEDLEQYLTHLKAAEQRSVRISGWVRRQPSRLAIAV